MFSLTAQDLSGSILGCADGPASFNAIATAQGTRVRSIDPLYAYAGSAIRRQIEATFPQIIAQTKANLAQFVWSEFPSVDHLAATRREAMERFLEDFDAVGRGGRYLVGELPRLPLGDGEFDLALCSHFLFLYADHFSADFHCAAVRELTRVAHEVRIFPLLSLAGTPSPHLAVVTDRLVQDGFQAVVERVEYEFQRGGQHMLRITRPAS
jgi:hypothetical protein